MITSLQTPTATTTSKLKQRVRPGLKLNTTQKTFEEENITITTNSNESYVVQNHPRFTDQNEFSYTTQKKYSQTFFKDAEFSERLGDLSLSGNSYYVVQRANGKEMQDTYKVKNPTEISGLSFFGVYDGHSTHLIAELLSKKLDEYIIENFKKNSELETSIKQAFTRLESEVMTNLETHKPRGGSTALCSLLYNNKLYSANLGDSRAVVIKERNAVPLSSLHDFTNTTERISVEQKGGTLLRDRLEGELALSRSIGDINFKAFMSSEPELTVHDLTEDDKYLLLGTDGFWNGLSPEQCVDKIEELKRGNNFSGDLKVMGDFLLEEAKKNIKTKKDNMTLLVVDLKEHFTQKSCPKKGNFAFF